MSKDVKLRLGIPDTVYVSEELAKKLRKARPSGRESDPAWTNGDLDDLIYYAWPNTNKEDLAAAIGVSPGTLRKRYMVLKRQRDTTNYDESSDDIDNDG